MGIYADFHKRSIEKRDEFWAEAGQTRSHWNIAPPQQICDYSRPPFAKWFKSAARTNLCHNAVDRHAAKRPNDRALVYISTETNEEKSVLLLRTEVARSSARRRS
jgi:propionyl-CoA synthetase